MRCVQIFELVHEKYTGKSNKSTYNMMHAGGEDRPQHHQSGGQNSSNPKTISINNTSLPVRQSLHHV